MSENKSTDSKMTESEKIWQEIHALPIDVFAIQGQVVGQHISKIDLPGSDLYVKLASSAVLPALEATLYNTNLTRGKKYVVEHNEKYVIIKRAVDHDVLVNQALEKMKKK